MRCGLTWFMGKLVKLSKESDLSVVQDFRKKKQQEKTWWNGLNWSCFVRPFEVKFSQANAGCKCRPNIFACRRFFVIPGQRTRNSIDNSQSEWIHHWLWLHTIKKFAHKLWGFKTDKLQLGVGLPMIHSFLPQIFLSKFGKLPTCRRVRRQCAVPIVPGQAGMWEKLELLGTGRFSSTTGFLGSQCCDTFPNFHAH